MAQTSFTIIEVRRSSSGQKNTPVIIGATINSLTARTSRSSRLGLQNDMRNQDCSPRHWMVGYNAKRRKDEVRICAFASHLSFSSWLLLQIGGTSNPSPAKPGSLQGLAEQAKAIGRKSIEVGALPGPGPGAASLYGVFEGCGHEARAGLFSGRYANC